MNKEAKKNYIEEMIKNFKVKKFIFASSSSVYGDEKPFPKSEKSETNPINLYSLSKLSNEHFARSMSKSMNTKFVGLRFFTIYGPWGRPDMMIMKYLIASRKKINLSLILSKKKGIELISHKFENEKQILESVNKIDKALKKLSV